MQTSSLFLALYCFALLCYPSSFVCLVCGRVRTARAPPLPPFFTCPSFFSTYCSSLPSSTGFLPMAFATKGVKATVGGKRMGDAALWAA